MIVGMTSPIPSRAVRVVLAHGASGTAASMRPHVEGLRARGVDAHAIDLPKRRAEEAVPAYLAAVMALPAAGPDTRLVIGGHSYGGRVASLLATDGTLPGLAGLGCFSYPLHRPGAPQLGLRTEHWPRIAVPTLILEGEADPFARIDLLRAAMPLLASGRLVTYPRQGHGLLRVLDAALDAMVVWDPNEIWGGLEPDVVKRARIILWKGHCSVHIRFTVRQIANIRKEHPGVRVIVHPEVPWEVVQAADDSGSTEYIIKQVSQSPIGSIWAVGTEIHLVNRLARDLQPDRTVLSLDQFGCLCSTMFRVSPNHLLWILEGLVDGRVHNRIVVAADRKYWTKVALDRMLTIR